MRLSRAIGCDGHQGICLKGNKSNNVRNERAILFEGCQGFILAMGTLVAPFQARGGFFSFLGMPSESNVDHESKEFYIRRLFAVDNDACLNTILPRAMMLYMIHKVVRKCCHHIASNDFVRWSLLKR